MSYLVSMAGAFVANLLIGVIVVPRLRRYLPTGQALALFVAMYAVTLPFVWVFVPTIMPGAPYAVAVSEAITFIVEGLIAAQVAPATERAQTIIIVWVANTLSLTLGSMYFMYQ